MCNLSAPSPLTPRSFRLGLRPNVWKPCAPMGRIAPSSVAPDTDREESVPPTLRSPASADESGERPIVVTEGYTELGRTIDRMLDAIQADCNVSCDPWEDRKGSLGYQLARARWIRYGWADRFGNLDSRLLRGKGAL
jgi:hypothetical protein